MSLKIGITEGSDPSYNKSWIEKSKNVDGIIIITKGLAKPDMMRDVLNIYHKKPTILHCTCTGWGGTGIEPGVPDARDTMNALKQLILSGFPARNTVLRIDPIIPTKEGLILVNEVLASLMKLNKDISHTGQRITKVRVSVMDNYKHVIKRFKAAGYTPLYNEYYQADTADMHDIIRILKVYPDFEYVACAETNLTRISGGLIKPQGCVSPDDLTVMKLPMDLCYENPQNRFGCHCLSCKTELLGKNHTCPHGCLYCYWKRPGE